MPRLTPPGHPATPAISTPGAVVAGNDWWAP